MDVEWLKARKKERKITDEMLAKALGVERSVANKVANGKVAMNARRADAVAKLLAVGRDEVLFRAGIASEVPAPRDEPSPRKVTPPAAAGDTVEIVALDLSLSMGPGTLIEDFVEQEPVVLDLALVQSITRTPSDRLRLVRGIGDSMEPTLRNGDRVMVDINDRHLARINGIYWVDHYGAHGIKRLRPISKDRVLIISDNPGIEDFEVDANDLRIEGRVIWYAREL